MGLTQKFPSAEMLSDEDNEQQQQYQQCQNNGPTGAALAETGVNVLVPNMSTTATDNAAVVVPVYTTMPCLSGNVNVNVVRGRHASYDFDPLYCPTSDAAVAAGATISSDAEDALTPRMPLQQQQQQQQMMVDQSQATCSSL